VTYEDAEEIMSEIKGIIKGIRWERNESSVLNTVKGLCLLHMMKDAEGFEETVRRFIGYVNEYKGQCIEIE